MAVRLAPFPRSNLRLPGWWGVAFEMVFLFIAVGLWVMIVMCQLVWFGGKATVNAIQRRRGEAP